MENKTPQDEVQEVQEPHKIIVDLSNYNPRLDPNSPEFDANKYGEMMQDATAKMSAMGEELTAITAENLRVGMDAVRELFATITAFVQSEQFQAIKQGIQSVTAFIEEHKGEITTLADMAEDVQDLAPFLSIELEEMKADPAFADYTLHDLFERGFDADGNPTDSPFRQLIERARQRKAEYEATEDAITEIDSAAKELPRIQYKKTTEIKTATDKLANVFFSLSAPAANATINGQRQMTPLRYERIKAKKEATLFYDYVYNEDVLNKYGLSKKFDDFDFFVMSIIDTLYTAGNTTVSYTKIYNEMGNEGSPTTKQLEPIYYSLLKGMTTVITIDDSEVQKAWKVGGDTYHEIVSPVIPVQLGNERFISNGRLSNGTVKINGISPFMTVAEPLGHVTAWEKDILRLYSGRKTKRYYSVMRFLMMQIGWMRNGNRSPKILYSTLYQHTGDTSTRAQQLSRDMMYRLLEEVFKPADYITAYKEEATPTPGVVLTLSNRRRKLKGRK